MGQVANSQTQIIDNVSSRGRLYPDTPTKPPFDAYHSYLDDQKAPKDLQVASNKEALVDIGLCSPTRTDLLQESRQSTSAQGPGGLGDNESQGRVKEETTRNPISTEKARIEKPEQWWHDASHGPCGTSQSPYQRAELDEYDVISVSVKACKEERDRKTRERLAKGEIKRVWQRTCCSCPPGGICDKIYCDHKPCDTCKDNIGVGM